MSRIDGEPSAAPWSWRCFFGLHRWPRWTNPEVTQTATEPSVGIKVQRRSCVNCNRMQARAIVLQQEGT